MDETRYLIYPISLNKKIFEDKTGMMNDIVCSGVYKHSTSLNGDDELGKFSEAAKFFGVSFGDDWKACIKGRTIINSVSVGKVFVSVNQSIVFDFMKNDKTEHELTAFLGYSATKSIIGSKPYIKMTNDFFLARFFGYASVEQMNVRFRGTAIFKKYSTRYALDKIKDELKMNWGLKIYARYTRGFYASYKLEHEDLVFHAELNRKTFKTKERKREEAQTLSRVLARINQLQQ